MIFASCILLLLLFPSVQGEEDHNDTSDENYVFPCNNRELIVNGRTLLRWKNADGSVGDITTEPIADGVQFSNKQRVKVGKRSTLIIKRLNGTEDVPAFTCRVVPNNHFKRHTSRYIHGDGPRKPNLVRITSPLKFVTVNTWTTLGACVATSSKPPTGLAWRKDGKPIETNLYNQSIISVVTDSMSMPGTFSSSSSLTIRTSRFDNGSIWTCTVDYMGSITTLTTGEVQVLYPTETMNLHVASKMPIVEGSNLVLECLSDGNIPPNAFKFHIKNQVIVVENTTKYIIPSVKRGDAGLYMCTLVNTTNVDPLLNATRNIIVYFLDLKLNPSGTVVKNVGEKFDMQVDLKTVGTPNITWRKNGLHVDEPDFRELKYDDNGTYECTVFVPGLIRRRSFDLIVQGRPTITNISEAASHNEQKSVLCEALAQPKPTFVWNVKHTVLESSLDSAKVFQRILIQAKNVHVVSCTVRNKVGADMKNISFLSSRMAGLRGDLDFSKFSKTVGLALTCICLAFSMVVLCYFRGVLKRQHDFAEQPTEQTEEEDDDDDDEEETTDVEDVKENAEATGEKA